MKLKPRNTSTSQTQLQLFPLSATLGTSAIPGGTSARSANMPDVTNNQYQTVFQIFYRVEDIGFLEILDLFLNLFFTYNGNGSLRWQISGDGGSTWITVGEGSFNVVVVTAGRIYAVGSWLSSIQVGDNKLGLRLQVLANSGTVATQIRDDTRIFVVYRKKVLF